MTTIAQEIKNKRHTYGVTQTELAKRVGITRPQIANIERGASSTSTERLEAIAAALGCQVVLVPMNGGIPDVLAEFYRTREKLAEANAIIDQIRGIV